MTDDDPGQETLAQRAERLARGQESLSQRAARLAATPAAPSAPSSIQLPAAPSFRAEEPPVMPSAQPFKAEEPPVPVGTRPVTLPTVRVTAPREPTPHGASGSWGPSIPEQIKSGAEAAVEGVKHLPTTLKHMGTQALDDASTSYALLPWAGKGPLAGKSPGDIVRAGINTTANAVLPAAGVSGILPHLGINLGLGAINDPEQPLRGAVASALLGEGIRGVARGTGKLRSFAEQLNPDVSGGVMEAGARGVRELDAPEPRTVNASPVATTPIPVATAKPAAEAPPLRAAIRTKDGRIFEGPLHVLAVEEAQKAGAFGDRPPGDAGYESGFTTADGRFLSRDEALAHAEQAEMAGVNVAAAKSNGEGLDATDIRGREHITPREVPPITEARPTAPPTTVEDVATAGPQERNVGLSLSQRARDLVRTAYRSAMVTPYAGAEAEAPALVEAMHKAGAAGARAQDVATYRLDRLFKGLTDEQQQHFQKRLLLDQYEAEAVRKGQAATQATDPAEAAQLAQAAKNFTDHADALRPSIPAGVESQPWFQKTLGLYKSSIEKPLTDAAIQAGVDPASLRPTQLGYMKLASEKRLDDAEIRQALETANVTDPADLKRRPALLRKLIGENPALKRYFAQQAQGPRQGPLQQQAGGAPVGYAGTGPRTQTTGSARMAEGTAESYSPDLRRILAVDTKEKFTKAANNQVLEAVAAHGRKLGPGELAEPGKRVLAFDQKHIVLVPDDADPQAMTTAKRYEVSPAVHDAVTTYFERPTPKSPARRLVQSAADLMTRAQISGMPVEATSHANTLASIISKVPGEKGVVNKALAAIPGPGAKAAAIREMMGTDFSDPKTIALRDRLADIGAMRIQEPHEGLVNSSSNWLFGPEGVDTRGRLVLARKYLARKPTATDAELREFITSQTGNYVSKNAGALPNFMAKGSFLSPFARFQAARIPTSIKRTFGESSLPATSKLQRVGDVANTLYRGPVGYVAGTELANMLLTGHSTQQNDPGHALDVNTGMYAVPGGFRRMTPDEAESSGDRAAPVYLPAATLDPVTYAGLRSTGARALIPGFSPEQPNELRGDNAVRDMTNVALGTAGPFLRGLQTAATGTQPFLQADGTMLRVAPRHFGSDIGGRLSTALGMANPAVHAFSASGGDASRTLAGALAQDGRFMGGPASIAAKIAEFTMPRVLAPAIGGKTNEQSADVQLDRRFRDAMADYTGRIKRAPGPVAQRAIIEEAVRDASSSGFDPDAVEVALEKAGTRDRQVDAEKQQRSTEKRIQKIRRVP